MAGNPTVILHMKDVERSDELDEALERRCQTLADEFSEVDRFEIGIEPDRNEIRATTKASGKNTTVAAHATAADERQAADLALAKLERELRSRHDKRIFTPRREARRAKTRRP